MKLIVVIVVIIFVSDILNIVFYSMGLSMKEGSGKCIHASGQIRLYQVKGIMTPAYR